MPETNFERNVLFFAGVIVPEIESSTALQQPFMVNFKQLMSGIEPDSFTKINLLVKVIGMLSWIYNLESFQKLSIQKKEHFIGQLYRFPISKIVGGLTGLKSLVFIAYYGIPTVWEEIHYQGPIISKREQNG